MSLSEEDMKTLTKSLTDVFTTAITEAAASLTATSNGSGQGGTPPPKPPRFKSKSSHADYARVYIGAELNNASKSLIDPCTPETLTFEEIRTTLISHFDLSKNEFTESVQFPNVIQQKDETIAKFTLRLRQAAIHCDYGDFLDRMPIEQMLHGLTDREMCSEIIQTNPSTFAEAYRVAHSLESTRHTSDEVKSTTLISENVNLLCNLPTQFKKKQSRIANSRGRRGSDASSRPKPTEESGNGNGSTNAATSCHGCVGSNDRSECPFRDSK
ncbi:hypothetical protein QAD02_021554 [Eretmocerus hayati]|uniref:Uncharacterized protein n=1 Tax=Eretmocerus hayati TaxID=131215 RepID=A0ACC2PQI0_9HYME|nr:hypothetical protein QAD02_021554 [Eretmocerus hayati]